MIRGYDASVSACVGCQLINLRTVQLEVRYAKRSEKVSPICEQNTRDDVPR